MIHKSQLLVCIGVGERVQLHNIGVTRTKIKNVALFLRQLLICGSSYDMPSSACWEGIVTLMYWIGLL